MLPQEPTRLPQRVIMPWPCRLLPSAIAWLRVPGSTLTEAGSTWVQLLPGKVMLAASPGPEPTQAAANKRRPATARHAGLLSMLWLPLCPRAGLRPGSVDREDASRLGLEVQYLSRVLPFWLYIVASAGWPCRPWTGSRPPMIPARRPAGAGSAGLQAALGRL